VAVIDAELKSFLEVDRVVSVGTTSDDLVPSGVRAWGPTVNEDGASIQLFLDRPSAAAAIANLRDNGRIAVCFTHVHTLRSVQLKGRCVEIGDPQAEDWSVIERHRMGFAEAADEIGYPKHVVRNMWSAQVVRVRFMVEEIFDQTPGPGAGGKL
jgi:hypothetical protein